MMLLIFGDPRKYFIVVIVVAVLFFLWAANGADACPACVVSNKEEKTGQSFWILSAMGIIPLVIGAWVFYKISRFQKNEKLPKS